MIVVTLQRSLPVFGGDRVTRIVYKIRRTFNHRKNNGVLLADHSPRMRGPGDFQHHVARFRYSTLVVCPRTLHRVHEDGPPDENAFAAPPQASRGQTI